MANRFVERLQNGPVVVADGGMGVLVSSAAPRLRCPEEANLRAPETVVKLHAGFIQAGADLIETNTFGANRRKLAAHYLEDEVRLATLTQVVTKGRVPDAEQLRDPQRADKDAVARELDGVVRSRVAGFGLDVVSLGIRDVILPGEMKDLMNKVTEAKKAAEANLIVRREETAAMRSQANTAKVLADNPTLMRLRELEVLEKVATSGKLSVVLGSHYNKETEAAVTEVCDVTDEADVAGLFERLGRVLAYILPLAAFIFAVRVWPFPAPNGVILDETMAS